MWRWVGPLALAGCGRYFGLEPPVVVDAMPDAAACTAASLACVGDVLRSCAAPGADAIDTLCNWGCFDAVDDTPARCAELVPSGGAVTPEDLAPNPGFADVTLGDNITIDGESGVIGRIGFIVRTSGPGLREGIDYELRGTVAVFRMKSLAVTGAIAGIGNHAIALVVDGPVDISAIVDMRGACANNNAGPGGFSGGPRGGNAAGTGGGGRGQVNEEGGGGGGHGGAGGGGGSTLGTLGNGGPMFGGPRIVNLIGGGGGGGGGDATNGSVGGGGGGALQIASNTRIVIAAAGGINAGGCGGKGPSADGSGGGGGAGGAILLEAPAIGLAGALAVNGGGGGGGGTAGEDGNDGGLARMATPPGSGTGPAGDGGAGGATGSPNGAAGVSGTRGGGGGGAAGRMRFNTRAGNAVLIEATAQLSPAPSDNTTTTDGTAELR